jgi:hypothetical protein
METLPEPITQKINLQLGDIIQLESPADTTLHNKQYFINYIDTNQIIIIDSTNQQVTLNINDDGSLRNESIQTIIILSRAETSSYALQNNLLPGQWIDIYFGGDIPVVITGRITNLDEDQIEVHLVESNETIYIDFAYKGIPLDIPIERIVLREQPDDLEDVEQVSEEKVSEDVELTPEEIEIQEEFLQEATEKQPEKIKEHITSIFLSADQIQFGTALDPITQVVEVPEEEKRYSIEKQTNDLLDELLSTVPNTQRTQTVLNNIHKMIERFKQLRSEFSKFDKNGNAFMPDFQGADYKPLVNALQDLNTKLYWILPVVNNKRKLYDTDADTSDLYSDISPLTLGNSRIDETRIVNAFRKNLVPDGQNGYEYLVKELNPYFTPFERPDILENNIVIKEVSTNITAVVSNLEDFYSSVAKNNDVKRKRFLIQTYNLGQNTIETSRIKGSSGVTIKLKQITKPDTINVKSLLTLPRSAVSFSHINLPSTNIFIKSGLNMNFIPYWRMLTNNTIVNTRTIDNVDKPYEHTERDFLRGVNEYRPDETTSENKKYTEYLKTIIPKTRLLFNLIKDDINGSLSLQSILQSLEPFMVYQKDLSFKQYEEITSFISQKIKDFKVKYVASKRELSVLDHGRGYTDLISHLLKQFNGQGTIYNDIVNNYLLENIPIKKYSNTELIHILNKVDNSRLYSVLLALSVKDLMIQNGLEMLTNTEDWMKKYNQISISPENTACKQYVLSKKYYAMDELEEDNDVDVTFDKQFDKTYYDVVDEYKAELNMFDDNQSKIEYLTEQLKEKIGMSDIDAEREAEALIYKKRFVKDGDYAVLHLEGEGETLFFKRQDNKWVRDETIKEDVFSLDNKMFCNLNEKCIIIKDECSSIEKSYEDVQKENITKIVEEFDKDLQQNADVIERILIYNKENLTFRINRLLKNLKQEQYKYDAIKYKIGLDAKETIADKSPYSKLLSLILSQGDFAKRQNDIAKFVTLYTRPANEEEDIWWHYCMSTNTKLLPSFVSKLAHVFINKQNYLLALRQIAAEQGTLSSDGDAVVDKYSGWVITKIDFSTEEGYTEEGFSAKSREVMERDLGDAVIQIAEEKQSASKYESPDANKAYRIVKAISKFMGLDTTHLEEFIINESVKLQTKAMPSKEVYDKAVAAAVAKGRKGVDSYEKAYNQSLIIITLSYFLIAIQTSIPTLKTRKTYPGCVKSFSGYPSFGDEDKTGITYVSCVANAIKSSVEPWNAIKQLNEKKISARMEITINKTIITQDVVQKKIREKIEYNLLNIDETIPEEHSIKNWINFLPPLQNIKQKSVSAVSKEYQDEFIKDIRSGNKKQEEKIIALRSKIIYLTLSIITSIQKVVSKNIAENTAILSNNANQPFLENACCNDESLSTTSYFTQKEPSIITDNESVINIRNILDDIVHLSKSPILFDPNDTRRPVIQIPNEFSEETIYKAVITYCKYNTDDPLSSELRSVCLEKPENYDKNDKLETKIEKLKRAGRVYNSKNLQNLLDVINNQNIVNVNIKTLVYSNVQHLRDILEVLSEEEKNILPQAFRDRLNNVLDTFAIGGLREDTPEMRSMKNYLSSANTMLLNSLNDFVRRNARAGITKKFDNCIKTLNDFILTGDDIILDKEDETVYKRVNFIKNIVYLIVSVYPEIIKNKVNYGDIKIPKHWGLSERHVSDIKNIVKKHYSPLFSFYDDTEIVKVFELFKENTKYILDLAMNTYYFSPIVLDDSGEKVYSILDNRLTGELFKFYILSILNHFVDLANNEDLITPTIPQLTTLSETPLIELDVTELGTDQMPQLEILSGEKKKMSEKIASLITSVMDIVCSYKETIDYNYETLMEKLLRAKEKEKTLITDYFKEMTDEEREIEKIQKNFKLERWSVGQQKGFRIYQPDTYDQEREAMENQYLLELKANKIDGVTDMNRDIYSMDILHELQQENEIEAEEYDISHIGEDNDNYGEEQEADDY